VSYLTGDPTFMATNTALLNNVMNNKVSMNFNSQFKGVWSGNGAYAREIKNVGTAGIFVSHIDYGSMDAYDAAGNRQGTVSANETLLQLGLSRTWKKNLSYGAGLKMAYSILGPYVANGLMLDVGANWVKPDSVITAGFVIRNAGFMFNAYGKKKRESTGTNAELTVNFKPKHMPFRFNVSAHNLQKWDITYSQYIQNTSTIDLTGEPSVPQEASFGDKFMRHITAGTELVLGKNFGIMAGYNHQRRREMAPDVRKGVSGFSWGVAFKISKLQITYASSCFFPGFNTNLFTVSASISEFRKNPASSRLGGKS
jgi:hypothetical protein